LFQIYVLDKILTLQAWINEQEIVVEPKKTTTTMSTNVIRIGLVLVVAGKDERRYKTTNEGSNLVVVTNFHNVF